MLRSADVVVIGGGIHGASLLYNLAALGGYRLLLIERGSPASGATGKSTGIVRHHYSNDLCVRLTLESRGILEAFPQIVGESIPYMRNGVVVLVGAGDELALRENVEMQRRAGIKVDLIDPRDLPSLLPSVDPKGIALACHDIESGYTEPPEVTKAYLRAAGKLGATVATGVEVKKIMVKDGGVAGVETSAGPVEAPTVVDVAGPWAGQVAAMAGVELPVLPTRLPVAQLRPSKPPPASAPTVLSLLDLLYWRPWADGTLAVGSDAEGGDQPLGPMPEDVDPAFADRMISAMASRLPGLGRLQSVRGWNGYDGASPDRHPILDHLGPRGFYVVAGFSGHGFKFAPMVGLCVAELIDSGRFKSMDLSPFRFSRFAEGKTFRGRYRMDVVH